MKYFFLCLLTSLGFFGYSQDAALLTDTTRVVDKKYREDQFYAGFTFNLLVNHPDAVKQSGFSGGIHLGFIRDMPINKRRNKAIGIGLGYSGNTYTQNLSITKVIDQQASQFEILDRGSFDGNRFTTHLVEMPLEYRWRTSTPRDRKFWRIYTGMRLGYLYSLKSTLRRNGDKLIASQLSELERLRLGATFTFGWNTFNFHFYYSLNSFFDNNAQISASQENFDLNTLKIGLFFYIL